MPTDHTQVPASTIPPAAAALGAAGFMPFVGLPLAQLWELTPLGQPWLPVLALYAAVILSFMGAVHWGLAMAEGGGQTGAPSDPAWRYGASVVPALVGWFAVAFLPQVIALRIIATAFAALLAYDLYAARSGLAPPWYPTLRWRLTLVVVPCLLFASILA